MSNTEFSYVRNLGDFPIYRNNGRYYYMFQHRYQVGNTDFILLTTEDLEAFVKGEMPDDLKRQLILYQNMQKAV